jgi:hypothetical protein
MNRYDVFPKAVETKIPGEIPSSTPIQRTLYEDFDRMPLEILRQIPLPALDSRERPKNKGRLVNFLSFFFAGLSPDAFNTWICLFPPLSQEILRDAAVMGYAVVEAYQAKSEQPFIAKEYTRCDWDLKLEPKLNLGFLWIVKNMGKTVVGLPSVLRRVIRPWFAGPLESSLNGCALGEAGAEGRYNNGLEIANAYPLLCGALSALLPTPLSERRDLDDMLIKLNPFPKRRLAALRSQCGFKPFPPVYEKTPDALDLAARFTLCMTNLRPKRPEDGQDGIKRLVKEFFGAGGGEKTSGSKFDSCQWDYLELHVLSAHLRKKSVGWGHYRKPPPSRVIFRKILTLIAMDQRWFSSECLARYIQINETDFCFIPPRLEDRLSMKAASLTAGGVEYRCTWGEEDIWPFTSFRFDLLVRPLFSAYCYLFAALGLLEITQKTPPEPVISQKKTKPFSVYDALDAIHITEFGRWCLDLTETRPGRIQEQYEAIADKELLLVTVKGSSFERSLYLDSIGDKLGEDRWRISPRSFIAGCADTQDIEERISTFKRLIDPNPAPHG